MRWMEKYRSVDMVTRSGIARGILDVCPWVIDIDTTDIDTDCNTMIWAEVVLQLIKVLIP